MKISEFITRLKFHMWSQRSILLLTRPAWKTLDKDKIKFCPGEFRLVDNNNLLDCLKFDDFTHIKTYKKMLKNGDSGQYGYLNGVCVYREWIQKSGDVIFDGCKVFALKDKEGQSCYNYCTPSARCNGFQSAGLAFQIKLYPEMTLYSMVLPENKVSLANFLNVGYEIQSIITVKNRIFFRSLKEEVLSMEEKELYSLNNKIN